MAVVGWEGLSYMGPAEKEAWYCHTETCTPLTGLWFSPEYAASSCNTWDRGLCKKRGTVKAVE